MLTVAIRGDFAARMRSLSHATRMIPARLPKDALLVCEVHIEIGYEPGSRLRAGDERQAQAERQQA